MNRLLGKAIKEFSSSTGVCDPLVVVDITVPNPSIYYLATMGDSDTWEVIDFEVSFLGQMGKDSIIIPSKPTFTNETVLPKIDDAHACVPSPRILENATNLVDESIQVSPRERAPRRVPVLSFQKSFASIIKKRGFNDFKKHLKKSSSLYLRRTVSSHTSLENW